MAGPRWVKLDVDYFTNPKTLAAGPDGRALHLASICWVGRHLTDGFIPDDALSTILDVAGLTRTNRRTQAVARVVDAGLWIPNGRGYDLKDFVEMNGSRVDHDRERDRYRERQRRYNLKRQRRDDDA